MTLDRAGRSLARVIGGRPVACPTEVAISPKEVDERPPRAPRNLKTEGGKNQVCLTWTAPSDDITDYDVRYRTEDGGWLDGAKVGNVPTHTVIGLVNDEEYFFQVRAENANGDGPWTESVVGIPKNVDGQPTPPSRVVVTGSAAALALSWSGASSDRTITDYDVRYKLETEDAWIEFIHNGASTNARITGLTPGVYEVQVAARNCLGLGQWSDIATGTVIAPEASPTWSAFRDDGGWAWVFSKRRQVTIDDTDTTSKWRMIGYGADDQPLKDPIATSSAPINEESSRVFVAGNVATTKGGISRVPLYGKWSERTGSGDGTETSALVTLKREPLASGDTDDEDEGASGSDGFQGASGMAAASTENQPTAGTFDIENWTYRRSYNWSARVWFVKFHSRVTIKTIPESAVDKVWLTYNYSTFGEERIYGKHVPGTPYWYFYNVRTNWAEGDPLMEYEVDVKPGYTIAEGTTTALEWRVVAADQNSYTLQDSSLGYYPGDYTEVKELTPGTAYSHTRDGQTLTCWTTPQPTVTVTDVGSGNVEIKASIMLTPLAGHSIADDFPVWAWGVFVTTGENRPSVRQNVVRPSDWGQKTSFTYVLEGDQALTLGTKYNIWVGTISYIRTDPAHPEAGPYSGIRIFTPYPEFLGLTKTSITPSSTAIAAPTMRATETNGFVWIAAATTFTPTKWQYRYKRSASGTWNPWRDINETDQNISYNITAITTADTYDVEARVIGAGNNIGFAAHDTVQFLKHDRTPTETRTYTLPTFDVTAGETAIVVDKITFDDTAPNTAADYISKIDLLLDGVEYVNLYTAQLDSNNAPTNTPAVTEPQTIEDLTVNVTYSVAIAVTYSGEGFVDWARTTTRTATPTNVVQDLDADAADRVVVSDAVARNVRVVSQARTSSTNYRLVVEVVPDDTKPPNLGIGVWTAYGQPGAPGSKAHDLTQAPDYSVGTVTLNANKATLAAGHFANDWVDSATFDITIPSHLLTEPKWNVFSMFIAASTWGVGKTISVQFAAPIAQNPVSTPPTTPTGLRLEQGDRSLTAYWNTVGGDTDDPRDDADYYQVRYKTSFSTTYTTPQRAVTTQLHITGLSNGVLYDVQVRALNGNGISPWSAKVSIRAGLPTAPTMGEMYWSRMPNNKAFVWWTYANLNSGRFVAYEVYVNNVKVKRVTENHASANWAEITRRTSGNTAVYVKVITDHGSDVGTQENIPAGWTSPGGKPRSVSFGHDRVTWFAPVVPYAITAYAVQVLVNNRWRYLAPAYNTLRANTTIGTQARVMTIKDGGFTSEWSAVAIRYIPPPSSRVPQPPPNMSAAGYSETSVRLRWGKNHETDRVTAYTVHYSIEHPVGVFTNWKLWPYGGLNRTTIVTGLAPSTSYAFYVRAWNVAGKSAPSDHAFAKTLGPLKPPTPDAPSLTAGNRYVTVRWTVPPGTQLTNIQVERAVVAGKGKFTNRRILSGGARAYTYRNLTNGRKYAFRVRFINGVSTGNWGPSATATPRTKPTAGVPKIKYKNGRVEVRMGTVDKGGGRITRYECDLWSNSTNTRNTRTTIRALTKERSQTGVWSVPKSEGSQYWWARVRAVTNFGGSASSPWTKALDTGRPGSTKPAKMNKPKWRTLWGYKYVYSTKPDDGGSRITHYEWGLQKYVSSNVYTGWVTVSLDASEGNTTTPTWMATSKLRDAGQSSGNYRLRVRAVNSSPVGGGLGQWSSYSSSAYVTVSSS